MFLRESEANAGHFSPRRQTNTRKLRLSCFKKGKFEMLKGFGGLKTYLQASEIIVSKSKRKISSSSPGKTASLLKLACVASVSVRFRRKERETRVEDREKSGASKTFWLSFHFSRGQNRKSSSSVFLCSETKRKRLLRRLIKA